MRAFYQAFPIWNALRTELSWSYYRISSRVQNAEARICYLSEAVSDHCVDATHGHKYDATV